MYMVWSKQPCWGLSEVFYGHRILREATPLVLQKLSCTHSKLFASLLEYFLHLHCSDISVMLHHI